MHYNIVGNDGVAVDTAGWRVSADLLAGNPDAGCTGVAYRVVSYDVVAGAVKDLNPSTLDPIDYVVLRFRSEVARPPIGKLATVIDIYAVGQIRIVGILGITDVIY
jgi:hypothetical protein